MIAAMTFARVLEEAGITPAEYAVMWHVKDTIVVSREAIAEWTASNLPNNVPPDISVDDCLHAIDSLVRRGLLIELTASDVETDLARWRSEALPVSWGVDRNRAEGDVDLTSEGFRVMESIAQRVHPD